MEIYPSVVEIFLFEPKWWTDPLTDSPTLPCLEPELLAWLKRISQNQDHHMIINIIANLD